MQTTSIASYIACSPRAAGSPRALHAKRYFCMSQLSVGCNPASATALADILMAAGHATEAAEFMEFTNIYFNLNYDDRMSLIEETLVDDTIPISSAA